MAGKKDTPISSVQADSYEPAFLPAGLKRVARVLAGRKRAQEMRVATQKVPFRPFAAQVPL